jgi:hypothetical protein
MKLIAAAFLAIALAGIGVEAGASPPVRSVKCQPHATAALVGRVPPSNASIRRLTGSATVRRIAPGDMVTQDYREDRVTVTVSKRKVVAASCG